MRVSTIALVLAGAVLVGGVLWMLRPAPASPEAQVQAAVDAMTKAARAHDAAGVLDHVSERFQSPELGGKNELRGFLLGELLRGGMVEARMVESRAESAGPGEVLFTGRLLLGRTAGGVDLGQRAVQATFADEQGTWRVVRAHVEPVNSL
jgi:ketosteroid isomerase-like protein